MRGSRNVRQGGGGGPGQSDKKTLTTFFFFFFFFYRPQLILLSFFKVPEGDPRGCPTFLKGGGGVQLLIPYRNPCNL